MFVHELSGTPAAQKVESMSEPNQAQTAQASTEQERPAEHPHGYTLADLEMERLEEKRASEDTLDPIALDDPVGMSVEKVIGRALVFVVFVLVVGILFAQVACKNIQLMSVASFDGGVDDARVEKAVTSGVSWAGEIVKFPSMDSASFDEESGTANVVVTNDSPRTLSQLVSASQGQALTLAMSMFENDRVNKVVYSVCSNTLSQDDSQTSDGPASGARQESQDAPAEPLISFIWQRGVDGAYTCTLEGYDPAAASISAAGQE